MSSTLKSFDHVKYQATLAELEITVEKKTQETLTIIQKSIDEKRVTANFTPSAKGESLMDYLNQT